MPKRKSNLQLIPDQPQRGSGGNTTLKMRIDDLITIDAMTETQPVFLRILWFQSDDTPRCSRNRKDIYCTIQSTRRSVDEGRVLQESYYCKIGSPFQRNRSF